MNFFDSLAVSFDLPILDWIAQNLHCPFLDTVMPWITALGDKGIFWIALALVLLCIPKYRKAGLSMGISLLIGLVICNFGLKLLFQRMRPYDFQLEHFGVTIPLLIEAETSFSFPSGHTISSIEAATALCIHDRKLGIPALVLAVIIAFSRMYLYVHYPTDVIASVILGVGIAFLACLLANQIFSLFAKLRAKNKPAA